MGSKFLDDIYGDEKFLQQDFYVVWRYTKDGRKHLHTKSDFASFIFHKSSLGRIKGYFKKQGIKYEIQKVNLKLGETLIFDK